MRPLRTNAGPAVTASSAHCRLGRVVDSSGERFGRRRTVAAPSAVRARSCEVFSFGVVELQGAGDGVEDLLGCAVDRAAFDLGVVLDAQPGERGDLAAPQSGHAPVVAGGQADLVRGDLGSA